MNQEIKEGAKVHYTTPYMKRENGIVKSLTEDGKAAFVVYHCNNDWKNFRDYTGARTELGDLKSGWVDERGYIMKEYCSHHYIPTNAKWQSATQVQCQYCGNIID